MPCLRTSHQIFIHREAEHEVLCGLHLVTESCAAARVRLQRCQGQAALVLSKLLAVMGGVRDPLPAAVDGSPPGTGHTCKAASIFIAGVLLCSDVPCAADRLKAMRPGERPREYLAVVPASRAYRAEAAQGRRRGSSSSYLLACSSHRVRRGCVRSDRAWCSAAEPNQG